MKPSYTNFKDIETDLKRLVLERQIAWEELKLVKNDIKEDLKPYNWVQSALMLIGKYGVFILIKKFIKK